MKKIDLNPHYEKQYDDLIASLPADAQEMLVNSDLREGTKKFYLKLCTKTGYVKIRLGDGQILLVRMASGVLELDDSQDFSFEDIEGISYNQGPFGGWTEFHKLYLKDGPFKGA